MYTVACHRRSVSFSSGNVRKPGTDCYKIIRWISDQKCISHWWFFCDFPWMENRSLLSPPCLTKCLVLDRQLEIGVCAWLCTSGPATRTEKEVRRRLILIRPSRPHETVKILDERQRCVGSRLHPTGKLRQWTVECGADHAGYELPGQSRIESWAWHRH